MTFHGGPRRHAVERDALVTACQDRYFSWRGRGTFRRARPLS
jgi:hypothetical protein